jgi:hypothetical protein
LPTVEKSTPVNLLVMKKIILPCLVVLTGLAVSAQSIPNPITWTHSAKKVKGGYEVHMTARIGQGYRIYGKDPGGGIKAIEFSFGKNPSLEVEPGIREVGTLIEEKYGIWNVKVRCYQNSVDFVAKVKLKNASTTKLDVKIKYAFGNGKTASVSETAFAVPVGR